MTDGPIEVTIRNPRTGHETVALPLEDLPAFCDRHLAKGKAIVAESGDESLVIHIGREILDFFLGRRKDRGKPDERVTVMNPMRGGSDGDGPLGAAAETDPETLGRVLALAAQAQRGGDLGAEQVAPQPLLQPFNTAPMGGSGRYRGRPLDAQAEMRAWLGLCERYGEATVTPLLHGGAIGVPSALWPTVIYLVETVGIKVIREGQVVARLCLELGDGAPIWDAVANRLDLLRAGREGEIQVWAQANAS